MYSINSVNVFFNTLFELNWKGGREDKRGEGNGEEGKEKPWFVLILFGYVMIGAWSEKKNY